MTPEAESHTTPGRTRLIVDISPELRRRIRIAAAERDLSLRAYIEDILEKTVPAQTAANEPMHSEMPKAVEALLQFQEQIRQAHPDVEYEDSVDLLRQTRQERDTQQEQW